MRPFLALVLVIMAAPALGGETPWQEVAPGVKLRLVSSGEVKPDGRTLAGIEIDMPASTKTYWRVPGDTGLPLELDVAGSEGLVGHQVLWPYPTVEQTAEYRDYVYRGHTVIPVLLEVSGEAPRLEASLVLGVCSEICIPAQTQLSLPLRDAAPDRPNGLRLKQALAAVPMDWPDGTALFGGVWLDADYGGIAVEVVGEVDAGSLIATLDGGLPLLGAPQIGPEPDVVQIPVSDSGALDDLAGRELVLTFMTPDGAFETRQIIEPAP